MLAIALAFSLCLPLFLTEVVFISDRSLVRNERLNYANFVFNGQCKLNVPGLLVAVESAKECAFHCTGNASCLSINYGTKPLFYSQDKPFYPCELLPTDKYNSSNLYSTSDDYHHYSIKTECEKSPCPKDSTCIPNYKENNFTCLPPPQKYLIVKVTSGDNLKFEVNGKAYSKERDGINFLVLNMNGSVYIDVKGFDLLHNNPPDSGRKVMDYMNSLPTKKIVLMGIHKVRHVPSGVAASTLSFYLPAFGSKVTALAEYQSQVDAGNITGWSLIGYKKIHSPDWVAERFDTNTLTAAIPIP